MDSKQDAILDEMLKKVAAQKAVPMMLAAEAGSAPAPATTPATAPEPAARVVRTTVHVTMLNQTFGSDMKYLNSKDWSGSLFAGQEYPADIPKSYSVDFTHSNNPHRVPHGSQGAVVYSGSNVEDTDGDTCAWLFAWSIGDEGNKVYVEAGEITLYKDKTKLNWDEVKKKLKNQGKSAMSVWEPNTHCQASAKIDADGIGPVEIAVLFAVQKFHADDLN